MKKLFLYLTEFFAGMSSYRTKCVDENRFQALKIKG